MLLGSYEIPHGADQRGCGYQGSERDEPARGHTLERKARFCLLRVRGCRDRDTERWGMKGWSTGLLSHSLEKPDEGGGGGGGVGPLPLTIRILAFAALFCDLPCSQTPICPHSGERCWSASTTSRRTLTANPSAKGKSGFHVGPNRDCRNKKDHAFRVLETLVGEIRKP